MCSRAEAHRADCNPANSRLFLFLFETLPRGVREIPRISKEGVWFGLAATETRGVE